MKRRPKSFHRLKLVSARASRFRPLVLVRGEGVVRNYTFFEENIQHRFWTIMQTDDIYTWPCVPCVRDIRRWPWALSKLVSFVEQCSLFAAREKNQHRYNHMVFALHSMLRSYQSPALNQTALVRCPLAGLTVKIYLLQSSLSLRTWISVLISRLTSSDDIEGNRQMHDNLGHL